MKSFLIKNTDKTVSVAYCVSKNKIEEGLKVPTDSMSDEDYNNFLIKKTIPSDAVSYREINTELIPADREFRNAWCDALPGQQIDIDLEKAKALKLDELRAERNKRLSFLDSEYLQKMEAGEDLTQIKAKRQKLRDATNALKALDVASQYNDKAKLDLIKQLSNDKVLD